MYIIGGEDVIVRDSAYSYGGWKEFVWWESEVFRIKHPIRNARSVTKTIGQANAPKV